MRSAQIAGAVYEGHLEEFIIGSSEPRVRLSFAKDFEQLEGDMDYDILSLCIAPEDIPDELNFQRL